MYTKKRTSALLGAALLMGLSFTVGADTAAKTDPVLAVVNGVPVTQSMYDGYLRLRPANSPKDRTLVLDELITLEVLRQDAVQRGIDKQPEVIVEMANHLAVAGLKTVAAGIVLNDEELHNVYNSHLKEMINREYKARHILIPTEEEAKAIITELNNGGDFVKLAKEKSQDHSSDGGDLGWFSTGQMVKSVADAVVLLENGKYTTQPVHSESGWHVILHEDTRENPPPSFEDMKEKIKMDLRRAKLQEHIQHLRAQAVVKMQTQEHVEVNGTEPTHAQ